MSIEKELGRLTGILEGVKEDVCEIKSTMITRTEFDSKVSEHDEIRGEIKQLRTAHDQGHFWRKIGDRTIFVLVGIVVTGLIGLLL